MCEVTHCAAYGKWEIHLRTPPILLTALTFRGVTCCVVTVFSFFSIIWNKIAAIILVCLLYSLRSVEHHSIDVNSVLASV